VSRIGTLGAVLRELLAETGVEEDCELRSAFGFMALHGGSLEQVTDEIARQAADAAGASLYAIRQPTGFRWHVPAIAMDPADSRAMSAFLDHVEVVVSVHGFGIDSLWARRPANGAGSPPGAPDKPREPGPPDLGMSLLLGGTNRDLAETMGDALRPALPDYAIVTDLDQIPVRLRGLSPVNPVNAAHDGGVQLECCPSVRGLGMKRRHLGPGVRPAETAALVDALAAVAAGF
jgi:phage replication-related protein YjqB (UPF0714/DUF867 family)